VVQRTGQYDRHARQCFGPIARHCYRGIFWKCERCYAIKFLCHFRRHKCTRKFSNPSARQKNKDRQIQKFLGKYTRKTRRNKQLEKHFDKLRVYRQGETPEPQNAQWLAEFQKDVAASIKLEGLREAMEEEIAKTIEKTNEVATGDAMDVDDPEAVEEPTSTSTSTSTSERPKRSKHLLTQARMIPPLETERREFDEEWLSDVESTGKSRKRGKRHKPNVGGYEKSKGNITRMGILKEFIYDIRLPLQSDATKSVKIDGPWDKRCLIVEGGLKFMLRELRTKTPGQLSTDG
jgi:hypothetical protein